MIETWMIIESNPAYEVSDQGQVRYRRNKRILKPMLNQRHVLTLRVCLSYNRNIVSVKKLVAEAFLPNPFCHKYIMHKNADPLDCRASNLKYYAKRKAPKLTQQLASAIRSMTAPSKLVAAQFNISPSMVRMIRRGIRWTHQGDAV